MAKHPIAIVRDAEDDATQAPTDELAAPAPQDAGETTAEHLQETEESEESEEVEEAVDDTTVTVDDAGAQALIDEPKREFSPTLELPTPHHWRLVRAAIADRVGALNAIAKKVSGEGYTREARTMEQDAMALSEDIAPQLETQAEIPLATADEVESGIVNQLRELARRHARRDREGIDDEAVLLKELGKRIERYAVAIADRAYAAGYAAREATPEVFAIKALSELR